MANESHVSVLQQGVEAWNQWREQDLRCELGLIQADLSRTDLSGAAVREADLRWT